MTAARIVAAVVILLALYVAWATVAITPPPDTVSPPVCHEFDGTPCESLHPQ
jgi:hypothetical protein